MVFWSLLWHCRVLAQYCSTAGNGTLPQLLTHLSTLIYQHFVNFPILSRPVHLGQNGVSGANALVLATAAKSAAWGAASIPTMARKASAAMATSRRSWTATLRQDQICLSFRNRRCRKVNLRHYQKLHGGGGHCIFGIEVDSFGKNVLPWNII